MWRPQPSPLVCDYKLDALSTVDGSKLDGVTLRCLRNPRCESQSEPVLRGIPQTFKRRTTPTDRVITYFSFSSSISRTAVVWVDIVQLVDLAYSALLLRLAANSSSVSAQLCGWRNSHRTLCGRRGGANALRRPGQPRSNSKLGVGWLQAPYDVRDGALEQPHSRTWPLHKSPSRACPGLPLPERLSVLLDRLSSPSAALRLKLQVRRPVQFQTSAFTWMSCMVGEDGSIDFSPNQRVVPPRNLVVIELTALSADLKWTGRVREFLK
uniref:Uncharacterized protein n=1 Tax=Mycena chlorophos TaxID=658473 RepID=A0ABQ0M530_MYCCL|nr:predicted protein [Mycena chlorophos]